MLCTKILNMKLSMLRKILWLCTLVLFTGCATAVTPRIYPGGFLSEMDYQNLQSAASEIKKQVPYKGIGSKERVKKTPPMPVWAYSVKDPLLVSESIPIRITKLEFHNDKEEKYAKKILDKIDKDFKESKIYQVDTNAMNDIKGYELTGSIVEYRPCNIAKTLFLSDTTLLQIEFKLINNDRGDREAGAIQINTSRTCGTLIALSENLERGSYEKQVSKALKEIYQNMQDGVGEKAFAGKDYFVIFPTKQDP